MVCYNLINADANINIPDDRELFTFSLSLVPFLTTEIHRGSQRLTSYFLIQIISFIFKKTGDTNPKTRFSNYAFFVLSENTKPRPNIFQAGFALSLISQ
jgi:hypothetical protein